MSELPVSVTAPNFRVCTYIGKTGLVSFQEMSLRRNLGTRTDFTVKVSTS
jgi:hypothetical protein